MDRWIVRCEAAADVTRDRDANAMAAKTTGKMTGKSGRSKRGLRRTNWAPQLQRDVAASPGRSSSNITYNMDVVQFCNLVGEC